MAIEFNDVYFEYPEGDSFSRPIFKSLSISFESSKIIGIVGPSGCGKSTILKLICGLLKPTSGSISIDGSSVEDLRTNGDFGIIFQQPDLLPWRSLTQNVTLPIELRKKKIDSAWVDRILKDVGLFSSKDKYPHELSGGMQQRAALARAIINHPKILLLDEPFSQLDELLRFELLFYVYHLAKLNHSTVFFVTHDISEAVIASDVLYILSNNPDEKIKRVDVSLTSRTLEIVEQNRYQQIVSEVRSILKNQK